MLQNKDDIFLSFHQLENPLYSLKQSFSTGGQPALVQHEKGQTNETESEVSDFFFVFFALVQVDLEFVDVLQSKDT